LQSEIDEDEDDADIYLDNSSSKSPSIFTDQKPEIEDSKPELLRTGFKFNEIGR
jgi:hypothetical protein